MPGGSRTIFVANIPFDVSEEQLAGTFSEAGPVSHVEIKFDNQTGRSKGYAFVQFYDEATADSAVRNMSDVHINGRALRVEASSDQPNRGGGGRGGGGGGGGGRGGGGGGRDSLGPGGAPPPRRDDAPRNASYGRNDPYGAPPPPMSGAGAGNGYNEPPPRIDLHALPPGADPRGLRATDAISQTLATIKPGEMQDVMAGMKTLVMTHPDQARTLLEQQPQLAYALFQAMLLMNIVDPSVLQRIQPMASAPAAAPAQSYAPPPQNYSSYPPQSQPPPPQNYSSSGGGYGAPPPAASYRPPQAASAPNPGYAAPPPQNYGPPGGGYGAPPPSAPPGVHIPPAAMAQLATLEESQRATLMQLFQLTPDQVQALDPAQRGQVEQLRRQFLGTA